MRKLRSTTFFITVATFFLNPIAWIVDWLLKRDMVKYLVENNVEIEQMTNIDKFLVQIPLTTLATAFVTIATSYVAGNKGKAVSMNLGMPRGKGIKEEDPDNKSPDVM
jgi:uncharacterized membrane protein YbaN (DUF454 family)